MKQYRMLGTTDEFDTCDICGRTGLKMVYALENNETGETIYAGSSCGPKALGWSMKEWKAEIKRVENEERERKAKARRDAETELAQTAESIRYEECLAEHHAALDRGEHLGPMFKVFRTEWMALQNAKDRIYEKHGVKTW